jgi:hypothetical protein
MGIRRVPRLLVQTMSIAMVMPLPLAGQCYQDAHAPAPLALWEQPATHVPRIIRVTLHVQRFLARTQRTAIVMQPLSVGRLCPVAPAHARRVSQAQRAVRAQQTTKVTLHAPRFRVPTARTAMAMPRR